MLRKQWFVFRLVAVAVLNLGLAPETPAERAVDVLMNLSEGVGSAPHAHGQPLSVPGPGGFQANLYVADSSLKRAIVLLHGVHEAGIEEPRIVRFAEQLSRVGVTVLTPALAELSDYRVTGASLGVIDAAVAYLAGRQDLVEGGKVGLVGFSFAGGLALASAAKPSLAARLEHVVSVGGHHDLERVLRFFLTNEIETPAGRKQLVAHEYGPVVLLYGALERVAPSVDQAELERAISAWLKNDRTRARAIGGKLKTKRGRQVFQFVQTGQVAKLAPELSAWIEERRPMLASVSAKGRLDSIPVPVYLLHGAGDRVIPPSEAQFADAELSRRPHRMLVTSAIEHVAPEGAGGLFEKLALVEFLSLLL